jgi:hypothetical protein
MASAMSRPRTDGRYLIYLVCVGEAYRRYAAMAIAAIRTIGRWTQDIVLLSDSETPLRGVPDVRVIDILSGAKRRYPWLEDGRRAVIHLKAEVEHHVDLAAYDYVLYLDCDVLVTTDRLPQLVTAWRREDVVVVQQDIIPIASGMRFAGGRILTPDERRKWGAFAINSGIVGIPTTPLGRRVLRDWRAGNIRQRFKFSDQGVLLSVLLRKYYGQWGYVTDAVIGREVTPYPETFVHFTAMKEALMDDYYTKILGLPLPE